MDLNTEAEARLIQQVKSNLKREPLQEVVETTTVKRMRDKLTVGEILEVVGEKYRVAPIQIKSRARTPPNLVKARHVAMYLAYILTSRSLGIIVRAFGRTDHTTARHAIHKIARHMCFDDHLRDDVEELKGVLRDQQQE